jgi:DNA-binding XRE family transcriptional regulator
MKHSPDSTMLPYEVEEGLTTLGDRVSAVRRTLGWTQEDLAAKAGVNKKTVLNVEHGRPSVGIGHLLNILWALDLIGELLPAFAKLGKTDEAVSLLERSLPKRIRGTRL